MSEFALSAIYYVNDGVSEDLLLNVLRAKDVANELADKSYNKDELEKQKADLQAAYDALEAAYNDVTSVDYEVAEGATIIYDLYGRRLLDIPASGLYIINGVKRYIHIK